MQKHMQDTRQSLKGLQLLAHKTREAEQNILDAARRRLEKVDGEIAELRPQTLTSPDAAERYQALILERGHLDVVIGQARRVLAA